MFLLDELLKKEVNVRIKNFLSTQKIRVFPKFLGVFLISLFATTIFAQDRNQISIFGGLNYVLKYGSEKDYIMGKNDFPVTAAHTSPSFGLSFARFFLKNIGLELDFRYNLSSKLTLKDPSDGDTIDTESSKHYSITGNLIYQIGKGRLRPYLSAGAGIDGLSGVKDQSVTSQYGYVVTITSPEKKTDFAANAGAGILLFIANDLGIKVEARYIFIPKTNNHPAINSINFFIGGFKRF